MAELTADLKLEVETALTSSTVVDDNPGTCKGWETAPCTLWEYAGSESKGKPADADSSPSGLLPLAAEARMMSDGEGATCVLTGRNAAAARSCLRDNLSMSDTVAAIDKAESDTIAEVAAGPDAPPGS